MKFLRVIATLDPRHGGPAAGLRAITPALAAEGHETEFASFDDPRTAEDFDVGGRVHALGPVRPGYGFNFLLHAWLKSRARNYDAVFVHGLWQYHGLAVSRALDRQRPYFVFPHGMLDPWFRRAHPLKHLKKWFYWQFAESRVLRRAAAVLFTCEEERRLARESFRPYRCTERVVAYGTARPEGDADRQRAAFAERAPGLNGRPYLLFLGRIHPKKGVDLLLRAYGRHLTDARARTHAPLPALVIAGPSPDDALLRSLQAMAAGLPRPHTILWPSMLTGDAKIGALRGAEAFVLPSHQENFGVAVAESLAVGTPVLISDRVNISAEIAADGAGLVERDDEAGTLQLLRRWQSLDRPARAAMRIAARATFDRRYEIRRTARSLVETISPFLSPFPS